MRRDFENKSPSVCGLNGGFAMRLFTALCFDDETKEALFAAENAAKAISEGKFTLSENLHLTLVFIGETERVTEIESVLDGIDFPEFEYKISGSGTFEKGIFWAGVSENEKLRELQRILSEKLKAVGFELEEKEFVPHITLARKFRPAADFDSEKIERLLPEKPIKANRISLMKSERIDDVLRYTEIYSRNLF